jgi:ubiquinone/menaquinone biosynthesis C-methylase UbiE
MMDTTAPQADLATYISDLDAFVQRCDRLIDVGLAYLAVILSHELFRFLYPVEPYADFTQADPVPFAKEHIQKLLRVADAYDRVVTPYAPELTLGSSEKASELEVATSDLYSELWLDFEDEALTRESKTLLERRLPPAVIAESIVGKRVIDVGCGSGRYAIALAQIGAAAVTAVDFQRKAFAPAQRWCEEHGVAVDFREANVLELPFGDGEFDFVLSNGVIHHSASIEQGLSEIARVMRAGGSGFLYLYAAGGIFWETRRALRRVFARIPLEYTRGVLRLIGMPSNRFIFCDTWYVPVETHTSTEELHALLNAVGLEYDKVPGQNAFDLDGAIDRGIPGAQEMWGDGEHRYVLRKARVDT